MKATLLLLPAIAALSVAAAPSPPAAPAPAWRETVRSFAAAHFHNPAWGYSHCLRDYALARALATADKAAVDDDVLFAAAFLHDQAALKPWEDEKRDHSDVAAELVPAFLKDAGFPVSKIPAVQAAIRSHMFYRTPTAPEAIYIHDADGLDWLGAIGVARVMALADAQGGKPDGPTVVKMLESNLADVPKTIVSPAGKALVAARAAELAGFLADLKRESADLSTL